MSDDLAFGMQTQHTTAAVPDRDYVPLETLLADNDNGSPAANNSKEHPVWNNNNNNNNNNNIK